MDTPEIDTSLRKPRQLRGFPANRSSAIACASFLGVACTLGLIINFLPPYRKIKEDIKEGRLWSVSEAQKEHNDRMRHQLSARALQFRSTKVIAEEIENPKAQLGGFTN